MHQLLHSVRWFNHFWPQVLYKLIAKIAKAHTNASRSPEPLENSLDWINFGSERSIACALLDNGPRRGERPVAEAAQRTWNRGADEKREHIGGCPTRNTHLEEGSYVPSPGYMPNFSMTPGYMGDRARARRVSK